MGAPLLLELIDVFVVPDYIDGLDAQVLGIGDQLLPQHAVGRILQKPALTHRTSGSTSALRHMDMRMPFRRLCNTESATPHEKRQSLVQSALLDKAVVAYMAFLINRMRLASPGACWWLQLMHHANDCTPDGAQHTVRGHSWVHELRSACT